MKEGFDALTSPAATPAATFSSFAAAWHYNLRREKKRGS
jgi:hypothetical protein